MGFVDILHSDKKYGIIYSDPPWEQRKGDIRKVWSNQNWDYYGNDSNLQKRGKNA